MGIPFSWTSLGIICYSAKVGSKDVKEIHITSTQVSATKHVLL